MALTSREREDSTMVIKVVEFAQVAIGQHFVSNGTRWIKKSSRTAAVVEQPSRVFYFGLTEQVKVAAPVQA